MTHLQDVPLDQIKVGDRYRKELGDISELAQSIREHGILQPITLDSDMNLLAGGRRLTAARKLGIEKIPCLIRKVDSQVEALEIELVENIHRLDLTWQERAKLEKRIYELKGSVRAAADALDQSKSLVSRNVQLATALEAFPQLGRHKKASDAWKELSRLKEQAVVEELRKRAEADAARSRGPDDQVSTAFRWASEHYKLGNAIDGMAAVNASAFDLAEVDPPYGIDLKYRKQRKSALSALDVSSYSEVEGEILQEFLEETASLVYRALRPSAFCIWWFGFEHYQLVRDSLEKAEFTVCPVPGVWYKGPQGQTNQPNVNLANSYEVFFIARKHNPYIAKPGRSNVFCFERVPAQCKIHPTERPLELMLELLETFAYPRQSVLVPFLGSGNTLRACYALGMTGIGWDVEPSVRDKFLIRVKEDTKNVSDSESAESQEA